LAEIAFADEHQAEVITWSPAARRQFGELWWPEVWRRSTIARGSSAAAESGQSAAPVESEFCVEALEAKFERSDSGEEGRP
jgi:hypothetical protein